MRISVASGAGENGNPSLIDTGDVPTIQAQSGPGPDLAAMPFRERQAMWSAVTGIGEAATNIVARVQDDANTVRVDDALNKAREAALHLQYDTNDGYLAQKGDAALNRPDGISLSSEYSDKLANSISNIASTLGNDRQRTLFGMRANDLHTNFTAGVQSHELQEFKNYSLSVQDGTVRLGKDDAERNWSDPVAIETALASVQSAVVKAGKIQGQSATEIAARLQIASSQIHSAVIGAALQNNNPLYAQQYLARYKDGMTAEDILKVNGTINHDVDARVAQAAVTAATDQMAPRVFPSDQNRLRTIVLGLESGGQGNFDKNGQPLTSTAGALYAMQVMPGTAGDPGYGVAPAKITPGMTDQQKAAEYNRVGVQYLDAMVKKYGNPAQAMAAYNAGPGATDDAIHEATKDKQPQKWLSYLPTETQQYVANGMKKFETGVGAPSMPTEQEFVNAALAPLGDTPRPQQVALTREAAVKQYGILTKSAAERGDAALQVVQRELIGNGGDVTKVSAQAVSDLTRYAPGKYDDALKFAKVVSKGDNETNPAVYMALATYPDELAKMSDGAFMQLRTSLSEADFKHFAKQRADTINGADDAGALSYKAINSAVFNRLSVMGINPTPGPKEMDARAAVGTIQKFVRDDIASQQSALGRKMTPVEIEQRVDTLFAKDAQFRQTWFNAVKQTFGGSPPAGALLSMRVGDIPDADSTALKAAFAARGVAKPTDDQLLRAYWGSKTAPSATGAPAVAPPSMVSLVPQ